MVGLGDIARKAYLPVLAARADIELHLATRNADVLRDLGRRWRIAGLHDGLDAALGAARFDATFVHAATEAHPALVSRLLEAGIATLVDKPLADDLATATELAAMAERGGVPLMVGFNRRHAPAYAALRDRPRSWLAMEKNRARLLHPPRRTVFDDFIHVVDTLRHLAPVPTHVASCRTVMRGGLLEAVQLTLSGDGFLATGSMHRDSGLDEERLSVIGGGCRISVHDLAEVVVDDGAQCRTRRGDWTSVERQRGFVGLCDAFLDAVRSGEGVLLDDLLETHRICELIVTEAQSDGDHG